MHAVADVSNGGGGLVNQIKKSYSLSDLSERHTREEGTDEADVMITDTRLIRKRQSPRRPPSTSMYFSEIDVRTDAIVSIQSAEDVSSGYSSGEGLTNQSLKLQAREGLVRSGSIGSNKTRPTRVTRSTVIAKKSSGADETEEALIIESEEALINESEADNVMCNTDNVESNEIVDEYIDKEKSESSSDGEFVDTVEFQDNNSSGNLSNNSLEKATDTVVPNIHDVPETNIIETKEKVLEVEIDNSIVHTETASDVKEICTDTCKDNRAGKYNKKTAPDPPNATQSAITATLVLKPGIIKPISTSQEKTEVFCHSPELKRRSLSKSRSPSPSSTKQTKKSKNPITKLLMLPKKMGIFKNDSDLNLNKRLSWHEELRSTLSLNLSKSTTNVNIEDLEAAKAIVKELSQTSHSRKDK